MSSDPSDDQGNSGNDNDQDNDIASVPPGSATSSRSSSARQTPPSARPTPPSSAPHSAQRSPAVSASCPEAQHSFSGQLQQQTGSYRQYRQGQQSDMDGVVRVAAACGSGKRTRSESSEDEDDESKNHNDKVSRDRRSNSGAWGPSVLQFFTKKEEQKDRGYTLNHNPNTKTPVLSLPKIEPPEFKSQTLGHLKQEYDSLPPSADSASATTMSAVVASMAAAAAAASGQGFENMDLKESQLRDLLLMASGKDFSEESAGKTLLQLSAERPDIKNLLTNGPMAQLLQTHLQHHQRSSAPKTGGPPSGSQSGGGMLGPSAVGQGNVALHVAQDGSLRPKKVRHKKRVNGQKICLVCGDNALAHNFDVITCESCKAFFRRNALKSQSLQRCMFQNSCTIDKNTRRFCPSCRLKKCFDIGMKPELMLDEEERRLRQEKKAQRVRRQTVSSSSTAADEAAEAQIGSSAVDLNSQTSFSPDRLGATSRRGSFSPGGESQSQGSSCQPSPLPSFHTLREPVTPSSSSTPSTPTHQPPAFSYGLGASQFSASHAQTSASGISGSSGGHSGAPSSEHPRYSAMLSQLSSAVAPGQSQAQQHTLGQQQLRQQLQSPAATSISTRYPRFPHGAPLPQTYTSTQLPEHQRQQPPQLIQFPRYLQQQQQQADKELEDSNSEPPSTSSTPRPQLQGEGQQLASQGADNYPYSLPGPAARLFTHIPRDKLPSDPFMYWIVSPDERLVLANLTIAYQDVLLSLNERGLVRNVPIADSYCLSDFLNEIDDAMYKIVQFSKHIADFRLVRKEDQIAMLKSSAMQTLGIGVCAIYVHERDCWLSLRGDISLSHLLELTNHDPYVQIGVEYCRSVKSLVKNDFTIYALIHCMILFDPRDAKIVDRQLINQTRDKFVIMLKHYLESQYSYLFADEYFVAIQDRVREMSHLAQSGNALFKRYSSAFQPLITEMLSNG